MTDFSHGHCGRAPFTADYSTIMTLLQNTTGGTRPAPFAVVLRPDLSRDSSQSHIAPTALDQWSDIYPGTTAGLERDTE
ncbi:hypothetical protein [Haloarcula hispanica]|uniref:hypothetical protein n=1 Tax=Haloarcula hispanica TaxID=51589 RepID=UPI0011B608C2|nr:hypothetical protein [Haloarcula hispanica]